MRKTGLMLVVRPQPTIPLDPITRTAGLSLNRDNRISDRTGRNMQMVEIYGLYCPDTGALRYIGKANCSKARLKTHILGAKKRKTPVNRWIFDLAALGKMPICEVIHFTDAMGWQDAERDIIQQAREDGLNLLNVADGGNEPKRRTNRFGKIVQILGVYLHRGRVSEPTKAKLRLAAVKHPEKFPKAWATI